MRFLHKKPNQRHLAAALVFITQLILQTDRAPGPHLDAVYRGRLSHKPTVSQIYSIRFRHYDCTMDFANVDRGSRGLCDTLSTL